MDLKQLKKALEKKSAKSEVLADITAMLPGGLVVATEAGEVDVDATLAYHAEFEGVPPAHLPRTWQGAAVVPLADLRPAPKSRQQCLYTGLLFGTDACPPWLAIPEAIRPERLRFVAWLRGQSDMKHIVADPMATAATMAMDPLPAYCRGPWNLFQLKMRGNPDLVAELDWGWLFQPNETKAAEATFTGPDGGVWTRRDFRNVLASFDVADIRIVFVDAGGHSERINWGGSSQNVAAAVLDECQRQGSRLTRQLWECLDERYPRNRGVRAALEAVIGERLR